MKFVCDRDVLNGIISKTSRATSIKALNPMVEGILIKAETDTLTVTGYDLSMAIQCSTDEVSVVSTGSIVLNAKTFGDIVKKLPEGDVTIDCDDKLSTTIKCGKSKFVIIANDASEYPELPNVDEEIGIQMLCSDLKSVITQTIYAVSDNETTPIHTGCLFDVGSKNMNVVAVDGYRLAIRTIDIETSGNTNSLAGKFVVPGKYLREIERILPNDESTVQIRPGEKNVMFTNDNTTIICRLIDGEFMNYENAVPTSFQYQATVEVAKMIESIDRVSLITSDKLKNPVVLKFNGDFLAISCRTSIGASSDEIYVDGDIQDFRIGFNGRYLMEAFKNSCEELVSISMNNPNSPMVVKPLSGNKFTFLVLPVRLREE